METPAFKRLPYGKSDFRDIILQNYAYIDKTRFIEKMENESNPSHFFIRPRKVGKSLLITTLKNYYDINRKDEFELLFDNLYIGKHPTPERNSYAIMEFDFSGLNTSNEDDFQQTFYDKIKQSVQFFLGRYKQIIPNAEDLIRQMKEEKNLGINVLGIAFNAAAMQEIKIYVIIDEYDHFANDLIAKGSQLGKNFYDKMVTANGLVRDFYERLKEATKSSVVYRTFITGISPVMLDCTVLQPRRWYSSYLLL